MKSILEVVLYAAVALPIFIMGFMAAFVWYSYYSGFVYFKEVVK